MNIPAATIQPFEPHGLPKLQFIKDMSAENLKIILKIMDALDSLMKGSGDHYFGMANMFQAEQLQAMADHLCVWLEKFAMSAGADTVSAKARPICSMKDAMKALGKNDVVATLKEIETFELDSPERVRLKSQMKIHGFMFLIDFTVGPEECNHLIKHEFASVPE